MSDLLTDRVVSAARVTRDNLVRMYRQRVRQCEALGKYAIAEHIRHTLFQEPTSEKYFMATSRSGDEPPPAPGS